MSKRNLRRPNLKSVEDYRMHIMNANRISDETAHEVIENRERSVRLDEVQALRRKMHSFKNKTGAGSTVECWNELVFFLNERHLRLTKKRKRMQSLAVYTAVRIDCVCGAIHRVDKLSDMSHCYNCRRDYSIMGERLMVSANPRP